MAILHVSDSFSLVDTGLGRWIPDCGLIWDSRSDDGLVTECLDIFLGMLTGHFGNHINNHINMTISS